MCTTLLYPTRNFICHFITSCSWSWCSAAALHSQLSILVPVINVVAPAVSVPPLFITFSRSFRTLLSSTNPGMKSHRIALAISFQWENFASLLFLLYLLIVCLFRWGSLWPLRLPFWEGFFFPMNFKNALQCTLSVYSLIPQKKCQ